MDKKISEQIMSISKRLKEGYQAEKVILFGSYARGGAGTDSDVDLFIIAPTNERFFERITTVRRLIRDLRQGLPLAPIVLTPSEVKQRLKIGDQFVLEIIEKGLTL